MHHYNVLIFDLVVFPIYCNQASGILKSHVTKLEQFCDSHTSETLESATKMNQLGVILTIYGDPE